MVRYLDTSGMTIVPLTLLPISPIVEERLHGGERCSLDIAVEMLSD
jgi:hypothetical protein